MERPSRERILADVAVTIARRGTCERAQVGAVIARDGRILATGYNGPPSGLPHCDEGCSPMDRAAESGCSRAVHAEANAIAYAARHGIATDGADIVCSHLPCLKCAELIINAGLVRLYYTQDYRVKDGWKLLQQAGVEMVCLAD